MDPDERWDSYMRLGPSRPAAPRVAIVYEYFRLVREIYGMYLAINTSLNDAVRKIEQQQQEIAKNGKTTIEELDELFVLVDLIDRDGTHSPPTYMCSQGGFKKRNASGGRNQIMTGNMCMVLLYQYWEDHYRQKIADAAGKRHKDDIELQIMGDLKALRECIIHHRGIAKRKQIKKCKLLKWFDEGDEISLNLERFEELVHHIEIGLSKLSYDIEELHSRHSV